MALIEIRALTKRYDDKVVLGGVDLRVFRGETLVVLGGSGSGKSTLLRVLIGALPPRSGKVAVLGKEIYSVGEDELASLKKHPGVAAVFEAFPDAKVAAVRRTARAKDDEAGTG